MTPKHFTRSPLRDRPPRLRGLLRRPRLAGRAEQAFLEGVDVFYLTDANGAKINHPVRVDALQKSLLRAAGETRPAKRAA